MRPLALLGGSIAAVALLPPLLASEPPPPPPADVGFEALPAVEPVAPPVPEPTVRTAAVKQRHVDRARKRPRTRRPAAARRRERSPDRFRRERRGGPATDPAPAVPAAAPPPAPPPTYPSYGGAPSGSADEFRFER